MKSVVVTSPVNMDERKKLGVKAGDRVIVWNKITEEVQEGKELKMKSRLQAFEGDVIAVKHGSEAGSSFTVRREASGVGVERIFPLYSPSIDKIEIVRRSKVRRAKLYYIRDVASKKMKHSLRKMKMMNVSTMGAADIAAAAERQAKADAKAAAEAAPVEAAPATEAAAE
jgi:large subunit ribosomal protein L19